MSVNNIFQLCEKKLANYLIPRDEWKFGKSIGATYF